MPTESVQFLFADSCTVVLSIASFASRRTPEVRFLAAARVLCSSQGSRPS